MNGDEQKKTGDGGRPGRRIEAVLNRHHDRLLSLPGVVAVGEGLCADGPCLRVFLARAPAEARRALPRQIEGIPVQVEECGEIRARPAGDD